eukprot:3611080-Pyramimonas_sp.AAC.1
MQCRFVPSGANMQRPWIPRRLSIDIVNAELRHGEGPIPPEIFCRWVGFYRQRSNFTTVSPVLRGREVEPHAYKGDCKHTGRVFGVGLFKTGTTSLTTKLESLKVRAPIEID